MAEPRKLKVLREAGYRMRETCSTCVFLSYRRNHTWGRCARLQGVTVHESGSCSHHTLDKKARAALIEDGHEEFLPGFVSS